MHRSYDVWTQERVDELTRLWERGDSAGVIGAAMMMTRNAILGKAFRLGLASRKAARSLEPKPPRHAFVPRSLKAPKEITDRGEPRSHLTAAWVSSIKKRPRVAELTKAELRAQLTLAVINTGGVK